MAHTTFGQTSASDSGNFEQNTNNANTITLNAEHSEQLALPDGSYVTEADMLRYGVDLVLQTPDGSVVVEGYFAQELPPFLIAPNGKALTPELVDAFAHSPQEYARANQSASDVSPIGAVQEITGEAHVIHPDGTVETIGVGTHIHQGDIVETEENGAVNIMFIDETTFAISEDARLAIDEYVFDPATQSGTTNFSVLKGVFVFTSGLIGREDPDDVMIDTPSGSIGIRGTIIAGDVSSGEITVIEGAIVLHDFSGNTVTLSNQYETARFDSNSQTIEYVGEISAEDIATKFTSVSSVSGNLFSSIEDSAAEDQSSQSESTKETAQENAEEAEIEAQDEQNAPEGAQEEEATGETTEETSATANAEESTENVADGSETQETTEEQPAEETTETPPAPEDTIITSDEITGSSVEDLSDNSATDEMQKPPPPPPEDTKMTAPELPDSGTGDLTPNIIDNPEHPTFHVTVTPIIAAENTYGAAVARVTGNFTEHTNLQLLGLSSNYYVKERIDDNNFIIRLKSSVSLEAENLHALNIAATNDQGTSTITQHIDLNIAHVNDPITLTDAAEDINYFSGTDGSYTVYNMAQEFHDPEGRIDHYDVTNVSSNINLENSITVDNNGKLIIDLVNGSVSGETFTFDVTAHASDGTQATQTFTYDVVTSAPTMSQNLTSSDTYHTTEGTINIFANNIEVYADSNNANNTFNIGALNATVKAGAGDDTFTINNPGNLNYRLYGESGVDTYNVIDGLGFIYAGDGNDEVKLNHSPTADLDGATTATAIINGGSGYDKLIFNEGGNIDFGRIDDGIINNFEEIITEQSNANVIDLTYDDVIAMTDHDNILAINTDNQDDINFTNTRGTTFAHTGVVDDYHVFTDGNITLLVDTDAATVTGIM